jgi:hypothetical protein
VSGLAPIRRIALAGWLALLCPAMAGADGTLLPANVQGAFSDEQVEALMAGFSAEVAELSGAPVGRPDGGPCPVPEACLDPALGGDLYWLQLSGTSDRLLAVAARLSADGTIHARGVAEGSDAHELGRELAAAVAAGDSAGLDVLTRRRGARVYLSGALLGRTPLHLDAPLPAGRIALEVVHKDGATALALLQARAGERAVLELDFTGVPPGPLARKRRGAWALVPILAGGVTAAILVATDPAGIVGPDHKVTIVTGR